MNYGPKLRDLRNQTGDRMGRKVSQAELAMKMTELRGGAPVVVHSDLSKAESSRFGCAREFYLEARAALEQIAAEVIA